MKRTLIKLSVFVLLLLSACASPNQDGAVKLDGPILESINGEGNLEFNGAVVNTGDVPVRSVSVIIILKDAAGEVVEANSASFLTAGRDNASAEDSEDLLYTSERAFFTLSVRADPQRIVSKDVEIYYEAAINPPGS